MAGISDHWMGTASDLGNADPADSLGTGTPLYWRLPYNPIRFNPVRSTKTDASVLTWGGSGYIDFGNYDAGNQYVLGWDWMGTGNTGKLGAYFYDYLYALYLSPNIPVYWSPDNRVTKYAVVIRSITGEKAPVGNGYRNVEVTIERIS